jgi:hypothetical protein
MTYREAFDATGHPRQQPSLRRQYRRVLMRWLGVAFAVMAWAAVVAYLDGAKP